jgi:hypothetical protein
LVPVEGAAEGYPVWKASRVSSSEVWHARLRFAGRITGWITFVAERGRIDGRKFIPGYASIRSWYRIWYKSKVLFGALVTVYVEQLTSIVTMNYVASNLIVGFGRDGVPEMEEQRREHKVRGQREPEGVQGGRAQGRVEARLRQRLPIHCHVRRRFSARVRFSLEDHPFSCAQPRGRPCPDSLEIRLVTLVAIIRFTS